jgi:hypothetical protein
MRGMGFGSRHFLLEDDGTFRRLSHRLVDDLIFGRATLPEYAGQARRVLAVTLDVGGRRILGVRKIEGSIWHFDAAGGIREGLLAAVVAAWDTHGAVEREKRARVPGLKAFRDRREWPRRCRWEPNEEQLRQILRILRLLRLIP